MNENIEKHVATQLFDSEKKPSYQQSNNLNEDNGWAVIKDKTLDMSPGDIYSFYATFDMFLEENEFKQIIENLKQTTYKYLDTQLNSFENTQTKLLFELNSKMVGEISENIKKLPTETYYQYLMKLIANQKLTSPEIYKKADISKDYFSKIITGRNNKRKFIPRKELLLKIAFAMKLSLEETYILLNKAGHTFIENDRADYIYVYFLNKKIYDIYDLEEILNFFELPALFELPS
ncbi:helix-turn-helix domain-containing protein [Clostridium beijerinckii]|uniref:helix-turn-helix domain-containing protein n=1 Tax=Clostridium beijerinckii TaxID=1520 RepID=UPI001361D561|nr:helix-turn-helix transcriptional regulator [Clostridium beijerinckii]MZK49027.1 hypothetical protein [Clostridium beijerinckii]MZK57402.1 hypothetical protein [Clostridium beijerinckii]MZK67613.1 hypothetical protein [Clostridium beijerinckii]MZK72698.1 hypothetical protein [Clostridium beijerinckii]MZK82294.1 hypothetical protein [Clostridium beijerinckii]